MRTAPVGSLEVSVVGLGCNNFGRALDPAGSRQVVDAALDAGINFFDTSSNYGSGRSEQYLGRALGSRRDEVVIATKFGVPIPGEGDSGGAKPEYVRWAIERSLRELGTDRIDLYQLHKPDPDTPIEETLGVMHELVAEGKVREIGCSNVDARQLQEALAVSRGAGATGFVSNQIHYSFLHREPEENGLVEEAAESGVALLPYYPLACGLLTGKARKGDVGDGRLQMDRYEHFLTDRNFEIVDRLREFAADRSITLPQVAIGWLLAQPSVPSVTPGATTPAQIRSNVAAAAWQPEPADLEQLGQIAGA